VSIGPSFLGGAQSRLLPMSIPFRFFTAAAIFHVIFWGMAALNADIVVGFNEGFGLALGTVHVLTLGVFLMTAIGASLQLLPVATRHATRAIWPSHLVSAALIGGTPLLVWGMATGDEHVALWGGGALSCGVLVYVIVMGDNLVRTKGQNSVVAFCTAALVSLIVVCALGLSLVLDFDLAFFADHTSVLGVHFVLAVFGFMGLLAFGFSLILIPMFTLAGHVPDGRGYLVLGLSLLAIILSCLGITFKIPWLIHFAFSAGMAAVGFYVATMFGCLKKGMRKRLGLPFVLIRLSWLMLLFSLPYGWATWIGWIDGPGWPVFGFALLVGWLLTFVLGILLKIVPFLSSMHSTMGEGSAVRLSTLTPELPQKVLVACHPLAIILVGGGIFMGQSVLILAGALIGALGAIAMLAYVLEVMRRLIVHQRKS